MSISILLEGRKKENLSASQNLYNILLEDILTSKLKKGEKLTERGVSEKYGISRTPVREAIQMLSAEGLVITENNKVTRVKGFTKGEIRDFLSIRQGQEALAAKWAAERIEEATLKDLKELFQFMDFYTRALDLQKMMEINSAFHRLIYSACENAVLQRQLLSYQRFLLPQNSTAYHSGGILEKVFNEHKAVYMAILEGDGYLAYKAMEEHMKNAFHRRLLQ